MTEKETHQIAARLDRLPCTKPILWMVILISLGFGFEIYDLFLTAYLAPGLAKSGYFTPDSLGPLAVLSVLGIQGAGSFVFALFAGLFVGALGLGAVTDRYGRRSVFTISLVWYSFCTGVLAFQSSGLWIDVWRFLAGIGFGVELVTIDTYLSELVPPQWRGRAFAACQCIGFSFVPLVAFLSWLLVPQYPWGYEGWRFVVLIGALGALAAWFLRRGLPESPRWLAQNGRLAEAEAVISRIERAVESAGVLLAPTLPRSTPVAVAVPSHLLRPPLIGRIIALSIFNFFQTFGYYGFSAWVPTLLMARGISVTTSLQYAFLIALANPVGPLLGLWLGDRMERKWQIVGAAVAVAGFGLAFATASASYTLIACGALITIANNTMSYAFHGYQSEVFPTALRGRAVGFVYGWSRFSAALSGPIIAALLAYGGTPAVFVLIALSMGAVIVSIGGFGPRTRARTLEELVR